MIFCEINVARAPVFDARGGRDLFRGLALPVRDEDFRQMDDAEIFLPRAQAEIRLLEKKEKTFVQSAERVPDFFADENECADNGFHVNGRRENLLLAGEFFWLEPSQ